MPAEGTPKLAPLSLPHQRQQQAEACSSTTASSGGGTPTITELLSPVEQQTVRLGDPSATSPAGPAEAVGDADVEGGETAAVVRHRRTRGRQSFKRFSDIMSVYIPVSGEAESRHRQPTRQDRQPLLASHQENEGGEPAPSVLSGGGGGCGPRLLKLLDVASLCSMESDIDDDNSRLRELAGCELAHVAVSTLGGYVFLAFADSPCILRLQLAQASMHSPRGCRVIEVGPLRSGARLKPIADLKVRGGHLYVSGCIVRPGVAGAGGGAGVKKGCVIARCDLDGRPLLVSKELPYPKFLGFDVDAGGELVVASQSPPAEAQVFRISSDFRRKLFKIQLGGGSVYRPDFVACMPGANACWVATEQLLADGQPHRHRLLSFPLRPPQPEKQEPQQPPPNAKSWLKVSSWKLDRVRPGRLLAVPSPAGANQPERLLMLSREQGNILCLGDQKQQLACTALTHPVSDGGQFFTSLCCCPAAAAGSPEQQQQQQQEESTGILATTRDSLYLLQGALA